MDRLRLYEFPAIREDGFEDCGGCNNETPYKYVLAKNKAEAEYLIREGLAGLCANCMCKLLTDEKFLIFRSTFPEEIGEDELELMIGDGVDYEHFESLEDAEEFVNALSKGISDKEIALYTQVDESGKTVYRKGKHLVNRTGVYMVAWK